MSNTAPQASRSVPNSALAVSKVPRVTVSFWILKVLTTGMGEAASDSLMRTVGVWAAVITGMVLLISLLAQWRSSRYRTGVYWLAVAMVSVFGTMAADLFHAVGLSLPQTSALYLVAVIAVFALWRRAEPTLSFAAITTRRREAFYWAAVLTTFALGTAVGDLTADAWGWGNLTSGLVFAVLIALPAVGVRWLRLNAVAGFWIAYILTRPLGASFADWMGMPTQHGGLGLGAPLVTAIWLVPMVALILFLAVTRTDIKEGSAAEEGEAAR